jgi:hypothetical protein
MQNLLIKKHIVTKKHIHAELDRRVIVKAQMPVSGCRPRLGRAIPRMSFAGSRFRNSIS